MTPNDTPPLLARLLTTIDNPKFFNFPAGKIQKPPKLKPEKKSATSTATPPAYGSS